MPQTREIKCSDEQCWVDMMQLHFTYDVPADVDTADFVCPACGGQACLETIEI